MPAVDLAAAALLVRRVWIGGDDPGRGAVPEPDCGGAIDIAFGIDDYLAHRRPRPFGACQRRTVGTRRVGRSLSTAHDRRSRPRPRGSADPVGALAEACVRPVPVDAAVLRRVERALVKLAPPLEGRLTGICPLCCGAVEFSFDPIEYVLAELREASAGLLLQVHDLARAYHWSEDEILGLDRRRRHSYVALVRAELAA